MNPKQFPTLDLKIELQQEDEKPESSPIEEDDEAGEWGDSDEPLPDESEDDEAGEWGD